jgi:hypothetical protein
VAQYRWHYDRNAVTGILYLNEVSGGETEMYSGCRIYLGRYKDTIAQRWLDKISRHLSSCGYSGRRCASHRALAC